MTSSVLDSSAPEPLYHQLRLHLLNEIHAHVYRGDDAKYATATHGAAAGSTRSTISRLMKSISG